MKKEVKSGANKAIDTCVTIITINNTTAGDNTTMPSKAKGGLKGQILACPPKATCGAQ